MGGLINGLRTYRPDFDHYTFCSEAFKTQIQAWIKGVPERQVSRNLMLTGASGLGKTTLALAACRKLGAHPSAIDEINCASMRTLEDARGLLTPLNFAPSRGEYRVLVLDECHQMVQNAQQAFLTPLENLPLSTIVVACTSNPDLLLPAFKRRFFELRITDYDEDAIIEILSLLPVDLKPVTIAMIVEVANGNPGRAIALAESNPNAEDQENALILEFQLVENLFQAIVEGNTLKIVLYCQQVKEETRKLFFEKILRYWEAAWMITVGLNPALPPKDQARIEANVKRMTWAWKDITQDEIIRKRQEFFSKLYSEFVLLSEKSLLHLKAWAMNR